MEDDAIQPDAPQIDAALTASQPDVQQDQPGAEERQLSPREQQMEALAASRRQQLQEETGITDEPEQASAAVQPDDVPAQIAAQSAPTVLSDGFDNVKVRAKIDGEEVEVTLDQVMRQYQKHSTADRRLAEATRLLREAEARAVQPQAAAEPQQPAAPQPNTKEFLDALFHGDEETAEQALQQLMQGRQAPIPDAAAIAQQVKQQIEVESALSGFAKDYADVVSDPYLADMADRVLAERLQAGDQFADALKGAGDHVRGWLQSKGAAPAATASTTRNERLDRKAALDTPRTANVTATSPAQQPRSEEQIRAEAMASLIRSRPGMAA